MSSRSLRSVWVVWLTCLLSLLGCKRKPQPDPAPQTPRARTADSLDSYADLCKAPSQPIDGANGYKRQGSGGPPSKIAVFVRNADRSFYLASSTTDLGPMLATESSFRDVELVACLDLTKVGEPVYCNYYGGQLQLYEMSHALRVVEAKTAREVLKTEFVLDKKTERCPSVYTFASKDQTKETTGPDYGSKLASLLLPLEPDGTTLPAVKAEKLDDVCSGSAVPQAVAYVPGSPTRVHLAYFPNEQQTFVREELPDGFPTLDDVDADASPFALVACVTGIPKKKRQACDFDSGKVLTIYDGVFEVRLIEARTGKLVETKTFKGTSPGGCPDLHKFWGSNDDEITRVEPGLRKYIDGLQSHSRR